MDFVAIDFETANRTRASACSIGLIVVEKSRVVDSFYTLIDPEVNFEPGNIAVHHITPEMVLGQPTFAEVWPHVAPFFAPNRLVVAHNATFDVSVVRRSLERYRLSEPRFSVLDTLRTSKALMPELPNHKLDTVARALSIPLPHHHNALEDTYACARILIEQEHLFGAPALNGMIK